VLLAGEGLIPNERQALAIGFITTHTAQPKGTCAPLRMICYGEAGTGKSVVLKAVVPAIGAEGCLVVGTTGVAAFNVAGKTIHSAIGIGTDSTLTELRYQFS